MAKSRFAVPELHCEGCESAIRDELEDAPGVRRVEAEIPDRRVTVEYDPREATTDTLAGHIEDAGFACSCEDEDTDAAPATEEPAREPRGRTARSSDPESPRGVWYALLALGLAVLALAGYAGYELYPRFDLPAAQGAGLLILAAGAGIASFFSPCAFPLLVTLLARETGAEAGGRRREAMGKGLRFATALSLGAAAFLLLAGIGIGLGGGALFRGVTFTSAAGMTIRVVVGAFLISLGLVQLGVLPNPMHAVEAVSRPLMRKQAQTRRTYPLAGFALFGFGYLLAGFG